MLVRATPFEAAPLQGTKFARLHILTALHAKRKPPYLAPSSSTRRMTPIGGALR